MARFRLQAWLASLTFICLSVLSTAPSARAHLKVHVLTVPARFGNVQLRQPGAIVGGPNGEEWVLTYNGKLYRIAEVSTDRKVRILNSELAPGSTYPAMSVGPFGAVWLVGNGANNLSTIGVNGHQWLIDSGTNDDRDIAAGPNGSVLVSDAAGLLFRYSPVSARKARASYVDTPTGISPEAVANSGRRVWFSSTAGELYRLTAPGAVSGPLTATSLSFPHSMTVAGGRLYAATDSGIVSLPARGGSRLRTYRTASRATLSSLAAGPDGDIWFPESGVNRIGRLNPRTGRLASLRLPVGYRLPAVSALPTGSAIARGPRNTVWFTAVTSGPSHLAAVGEITGLVSRK